jgi:hypothetical protein
MRVGQYKSLLAVAVVLYRLLFWRLLLLVVMGSSTLFATGLGSLTLYRFVVLLSYHWWSGMRNMNPLLIVIPEFRCNRVICAWDQRVSWFQEELVGSAIVTFHCIRNSRVVGTTGTIMHRHTRPLWRIVTHVRMLNTHTHTTTVPRVVTRKQTVTVHHTLWTLSGYDTDDRKRCDYF